MAPKKPTAKAKAEAAPPDEPVVPSQEPPEPAAAEDLHLPEETSEELAPPAPAPIEPPKPIHGDSFDEVYVGPGEIIELPDVETLPDIFELAGIKPADAKSVDMEESGYRTEQIRAAGQINLVWHPTIMCGRCELCGSTRYVGGEVWKRIERKTGEVTYKYRGGRWVEIDAAHCPHYRHIQIRCSYCSEEFTGTKDRLKQFNEVLGSRVVFVVSQPGRPKNLIMVCSDFTCKNKFNEQFNINNGA